MKSCVFAALMYATFCGAQGLVPGGLSSAGTDAAWLQLNCHHWDKDQSFKPQWTVIISSKQPGVKQLRADRWEISFKD